MAGHALNWPERVWTPEQHAVAMHLWRDGIQVVRIGETVGRSKNAVISRARRYGFGRHPNGHDYRQGRGA